MRSHLPFSQWLKILFLAATGCIPYLSTSKIFIRKLMAGFLFVIISLSAYAQPPNDEPCNALPLPVLGACSFVTYNNIAATASTVPSPGCGNYQGGDVWFTAIVPCNGTFNIDTRNVSITDGGMAIYSGTCNALTLIDCDDDGSPNGLMPFISASNLTPGSTIYIRFWEYGNDNQGTFEICATQSSTTGAGTTCNAPLPFCSSNTYSFPNSTSTPSLGGGGIYGCLQTTPNPVWYFLQIQNTGPLNLTITQTSTAGTPIDVDFVLWGPFSALAGSCAAISASNIVDCSYEPWATEFVDIPNAQAGQFYILLMTNFEDAPGTITFQQTGGTASTNCAIICDVTAGNTGPVCVGGTFDLTSSIPGGFYNWTGPNCFTSTLQNPTGVTAPSVPGTYTYTVSVTGANGAICTASTTVTVGSLAGTAAAVNTTCAGTADGSITVTPNTTGTFIYTLNPGNIVQNNNPTFTGLAAGAYIVSFSNGTGCTGSVNVTVNPGAGINAGFTSVATSCPTVNNGSVTITPTSGTAPFMYSINAGAPQASNQFNNLPAGNHTVLITDANNCQGTLTVTVTAGTSISSTISSTQPVCSNINDGTITVNPTSGTAPYSYSLNAGTPQPGNTFTGLGAGTYNISITDALGCTGSNTVTLTTNPPIVFTTASTNAALCNGTATGSLTVTASGGVASYQYALSPFTVFQASGNFTNLPAGTYTIRVRDNVGCIKDTALTITQPTLLNNTATATGSAGCSNNDGIITAAATGGVLPYRYTIAGPTVNTSGATSGIFTGLSAGTYTITATDANNCTANATATIIIIDNMFLNIGADTTICAESSITFLPQTNPETNIFSWTGINGTATSTIANPSVKNAVASPVDTSMYVLHAQWGGCERWDTILVNLLHKPVANAGNDTAICHLTYATLVGSAANVSGAVSYEWTPSTNVEFPTQAITNVNPAGSDTTYTYTLIVRDNYGCNFSVSDQVKVRVQPPVPAYAGNDTTATLGVAHQLTSGGGSTYLWSPAGPLNDASLQNPLAILSQDQKFIVQVTDFAGCIGYDTVFLKVYAGPAYYIPNAFTPNGDGLNDVFRPIPVGVTKTEWFRVFNRFGEMVFETTQWMKGWDGSFRGKKQPMGAYTWIIKGIDRNGKKIEMKGTVMLVQ
jgi:gliding motility-associated-like protein